MDSALGSNIRNATLDKVRGRQVDNLNVEHLISTTCRDCMHTHKHLPHWEIVFLTVCVVIILLTSHYSAYWVGRGEQQTIQIISSGSKARSADLAIAKEEKRLRRIGRKVGVK